ncbi:hypothetical protein D3C73_1123190 [compost metagenome]
MTALALDKLLDNLVGANILPYPIFVAMEQYTTVGFHYVIIRTYFIGYIALEDHIQNVEILKIKSTPDIPTVCTILIVYGLTHKYEKVSGTCGYVRFGKVGLL